MSNCQSHSNAYSGRHANIFRPPNSTANITHATDTDYFNSPGSRKRYRQQQIHTSNEPQHRNINCTPRQRSGDRYSTSMTHWAQTPTSSLDNMQDSTDSLFFGQNSTHVNDSYNLAGGLDTPSLQAAAIEHEQVASGFELERRRRAWGGGEGRGGEQLHLGAMHVETMPISGPLARERNGVARIIPSQNISSTSLQQDHYLQGDGHGGGKMGWTSFAFNVVGKLFSFGSNVFRGFYAGGGKGYDLKCTPQPASSFQPQWIGAPPMSPPLPGSWHIDNSHGFFGDFEQDNVEAVERPTGKRRQTDKDSWVMVGTPDLDGHDSPKRKVSSSASVPTRNSFVPQRPTASRASSRRSMIPTPSRRQSYTTSTSNATAQSPFGDYPRRASVANPRSPPIRHRSNSYGFPRPSTPNSPSLLSPEAEKYARRQAKRDRVADNAMNNMGRNIQDLIRQAQEALGTKYSVEGDAADVDEGFVDEDW